MTIECLSTLCSQQITRQPPLVWGQFLLLPFQHLFLLVFPETTSGPRHEKTNNVVSNQDRHKTELYKHRRLLEAGNFRFRKKRNCSIFVAKTKVLI